ncbi:glycosyltransferase family 32 protein [Pseudoalteromonas mariniglutinosa]|uniref:glycosyltransferase family 32 protein n=1 Tax=Pseudoalteromonas mariniglutinosa TaxID=206042 RepID=UPI00384E7A59
MIPKIIHFVWVGGSEKPEKIQKCMNTWKLLEESGFEIKEWNEDSFDVMGHEFTRKAYEQKKWAFVSDYIRAFAVHKFGGVYLDTDIIIRKDLTPLLDNDAFVGYESDEYPFTAVFGAVKGHPFVKDMLDMFDAKQFNLDLDDPYAEVNTKTVSDILVDKYKCEIGNKEQLLAEGIKVYPKEILCMPTFSSYAVHVFTRTWLEDKKGIIRRFTTFLRLRCNNYYAMTLLVFIRWLGQKLK